LRETNFLSGDLRDRFNNELQDFFGNNDSLLKDKLEKLKLIQLLVDHRIVVVFVKDALTFDRFKIPAYLFEAGVVYVLLVFNEFLPHFD